jgi:UDP:flavonoid glycosyltransferase YjiC (YdhE family)
LPLVPFAAALLRAGDEVLAAVPRESIAMAAAAGLDVWAVHDVTREQVRAVMASLPVDRPSEAGQVLVREVFGRLHTSAALPGVRDAIVRFAPDLVLRETFHYASALAAEEAQVPHVRIATGMAGVDGSAVAIAAEGFPPIGGAVDAVRRTPILTLAPQSLESPELPPAAVVRRYRDRTEPTPPDGLEPGWLAAGDAPLVYVTLGSVASGSRWFPDLIGAVFGSLARLRLRALVTVGDRVDPAQLGQPPPNVRVERWVPQAEVLGRAAAMLCHGGFGTVLGGLRAGVPMVLLPMVADQTRNATRVDALGAGIKLDRGERSGVRLDQALSLVLEDPRFAAAAGRVAGEIAALAPIDEAVAFLRARAR